MDRFDFQPLYYGEKLHAVNPRGDVGFLAFWSPIKTVLAKLTDIGVDLSATDSRIAAIGNLYGDGFLALLCNLLNNPQIRHLVAAGQDLSGCAGELAAFLADGTEPVELLGKPMRQVIGTNRRFPEPPGFDEAGLRARVSFAYFGKLSDARVREEMADYLRDLPRGDGAGQSRTVVDLPTASEADFSYKPSNPAGHMVTRRRPLEAWRELVARTVRFGRPVRLAKGVRLELLNAKVVIQEPVEDDAADLATYGFSLERFRAYQQAILEPDLPEGISYTYGNRLRGFFRREGGAFLDSLALAAKTLRDDPSSRQAYVSLWDTAQDIDLSPSSPCLTTIFFRNSDAGLTLTATYRAHNLLTAWLENVYGLMAIQRCVAQQAGLRPGPITVMSHSLGANPDSTRMSVGEAIANGWTRDDDIDPETGKPVLREDPHGYFVLSKDDERQVLIADHMYDGVLIKRYEARKAADIENQVSAEMAISLVSHAMWFGRELAKLEAALRESVKKSGSRLS